MKQGCGATTICQCRRARPGSTRYLSVVLVLASLCQVALPLAAQTAKEDSADSGAIRRAEVSPQQLDQPYQTQLDEWAFLLLGPAWPEQFALIHPQATMEQIEDGVQVSVQQPLPGAWIAYRRKLRGDFFVELDIDVHPRKPAKDDQDRFQSPLPPLGKIGFRTSADQPAVLSQSLPPGWPVGSEDRARPIKVSVKRVKDALTLTVGDQTKRTRISDGSTTGFVVLQAIAPAKFSIKRIRLLGKASDPGFALPKMTASGPSVKPWTVTPANISGTPSAELLIRDGRLSIEPTGAKVPARIRFAKQFGGDVYLCAKLVIDSSNQGNRRNKHVVSCRLMSPGQPEVVTLTPRFPQNENHVWVTLGRSGSKPWASSGTKAFSGNEQAGPIYFELTTNTPITLEQLSIFADSAADAEQTSFAAGGWSVRKNGPGWRVDYLDQMQIAADGDRIKIRNDTPLPVIRKLEADGDFRAKWNVVFAHRAADAEADGGLRVWVKGRTRYTYLDLPPPAAGSPSQHQVRLQRQGDHVTLQTPVAKRQVSIPGPLTVQLQSKGNARYWIDDFAIHAGTTDALETAQSLDPKMLKQPGSLAGNIAIEEVQLPAPVSQIDIAGGGRYLLMYSKETGKFLVFDVQQRTLVGKFAIKGPILIAGGAEHFVIAYTDSGMLSRYRIHPTIREKTTHLALPPTMEQRLREQGKPAEAGILAIAMGCATAGPLLVGREEHQRGFWSLVDLQNLQPLDLTLADLPSVNKRQTSRPRAAASMSVFGIPANRFDRRALSGAALLSVRGDQVTVKRNEQLWRAIPGPLGRNVFSNAGIANTELQIFDRFEDQFALAMPATSGPFYTKLEKTNSLLSGEDDYHVVLRLPNHQWPIATLDALRIDADQVRDSDGIPFDRRVLFHPAAGVVVCLAETNDRLLIHDIDPQQQLQASGQDYFYVSGPAPDSAIVGKRFKHRIVPHTNQGPVRYELSAHPPGMTISSKGEIEWQVPVGATDDFVIITLTNEKNNSIFHTIAVRVATDSSSGPELGSPE